jgi:hypothetical protein
MDGAGVFFVNILHDAGDFRAHLDHGDEPFEAFDFIITCFLALIELDLQNNPPIVKWSDAKEIIHEFPPLAEAAFLDFAARIFPQKYFLKIIATTSCSDTTYSSEIFFV